LFRGPGVQSARETKNNAQDGKSSEVMQSVSVHYFFEMKIFSEILLEGFFSPL
jgi:hypothetical protein